MRTDGVEGLCTYRVFRHHTSWYLPLLFRVLYPCSRALSGNPWLGLIAMPLEIPLFLPTHATQRHLFTPHLHRPSPRAPPHPSPTPPTTPSSSPSHFPLPHHQLPSHSNPPTAPLDSTPWSPPRSWYLPAEPKTPLLPSGPFAAIFRVCCCGKSRTRRCHGGLWIGVRISFRRNVWLAL